MVSKLLGRGLTKKDFVEIQASLNVWKWDDRLGKKPEKYDEASIDEKFKMNRPYMDELKTIVSEYDRLLYWQCEKKPVGMGLSIDEFESNFDERIIQPEVYRVGEIAESWGLTPKYGGKSKTWTRWIWLCLSIVSIAISIIVLLH